jgi:hypothetical protein
MSDKKITQLTALTGADTVAGDQLAIVDVSDTTMSASGTTKKIALSELQAAPLSAGTANGVAYLNGSKVLTTGSALTFDGVSFVAPILRAFNGILETKSTISDSYNILNEANAISVGPIIKINTDVVVTVAAGSTWSISA